MTSDLFPFFVSNFFPSLSTLGDKYYGQYHEDLRHGYGE